ncbi:outer membrane protein with beta-barrel domain [Sediminibacterium magnilacihabitans]|jgi:hypothetical protein|nr:outer membrane protein with beta-barrel domain [Sediminibacterium magnilacihabitans]
MTKKKAIIIMLQLLPTIGSTQISIGLESGYSNNHLSTDISNRLFTTNKNGNSIGIGCLLKYDITKRVEIQTGLNLIGKEYSYSRNGNFAGIYETFKNFYFQIPIIVAFKFYEKKKTSVFLNTGLFGAYWAFAKVNGRVPNIFNSRDSININGEPSQYIQLYNYSEKYRFNTIKDNRVEFGWIMGLCVDYQFNKKYSAFIACNYYQSLSDQQKNYMYNQTPRYNQTAFISLGCLLSIKKRKFK